MVGPMTRFRGWHDRGLGRASGTGTIFVMVENVTMDLGAGPEARVGKHELASS